MDIIPGCCPESRLHHSPLLGTVLETNSDFGGGDFIHSDCPLSDNGLNSQTMHG